MELFTQIQEITQIIPQLLATTPPQSDKGLFSPKNLSQFSILSNLCLVFA
jgi:hypothetical protein